MPTYRSINMMLHSQFDVETLPEYCPPPKERCAAARVVPELIDDASSTCTVYVPVLPGSLFWIGYSVSPPVPDGHYFLFKLYINGAHIVNWSTGKEDDWKGKTMFSLYNRPGLKEKQRLEKRALRFAALEDVADPLDAKMCVEIRVHRAHGRMRIERELERYEQTEHARRAKGIHLINAGRASSEQAKRFYKFALIDPVDQPFVVFKYLYRTWDQLQHLGVLAEDSTSEDLPVIEPDDSSVSTTRTVSSAFVHDDDVFYDCGDSAAQGIRQTESPGLKTAQDGTSSSEQPRAYVPRGAPMERASGETLGQEKTQQRHSGLSTPPQLYRLSVPPSIKLRPSLQKARNALRVAKQSDSISSTAYSRHSACAVEEWRMRTPSPVKSMRESISTPPMGKSRASSLFGVFTSTWKRRGKMSSGGGRNAEKQGGSRSVSR
ncbi:hypothetical protein ACEQ8H_005675 [Pleosporales sp. CAS-2024a]